MYERAFRLRGHSIEVAYDGDTALERLKTLENSPDAVIMDIVLPHLGGIELLKEMRADPKLAKIPVAVLTNSYHAEDTEKFLALGADLYLVKIENQAKDVVEKVETLIDKSKARVGDAS